MKLAMNAWGWNAFPVWLPVYTIEETISRVSAIGYDGIEIGAASPHLWPKYTSKEKRKQLAKLIKESNLEVSSICPAIGGGPGLSPASPLEIERKESVNYYRECIELAADIGSKIVIYVGGCQVFGTPYDQAWKWSSEALKGCVNDAEKLGIILVVEPTSADSNIINSADDAIKMMKEANSKNVKLMFDTYHCFTKTADSGTPIDYIKKMGKDLVHMHLSDVNRLPPGTKTDFRPMIAELKKTNYNGFLSVEIWSPDPDDYAYRAFQYLKPLVK